MQAGHGIPSVGQILPYVLRHCWRATDAGAWRDPGHTVGQALSASVKPTFRVGPAFGQVYPILFHGLWCAPAHELLLANPKKWGTSKRCLFTEEVGITSPFLRLNETQVGNHFPENGVRQQYQLS